MNELDEIRERKLLELQKRLEEEKVERYKKNMLINILTKKAYQRLAFVKHTHPKLAQLVENAILQYSMTNPNVIINEEQLKNILYELSSTTKRDFKIIRK